MLSEERKKELYKSWLFEDADDDNEWFHELTSEEQELVLRWDKSYRASFIDMCERIIELDKNRQKAEPVKNMSDNEG